MHIGERNRISERYIGTVAYMGGIFAVPENFCWAWSQMIQYNTEYMLQPGERIHYHKSGVSFHASARNSLAQEMRGEWLFMTDTDHIFEPDIVARMVRLMNVHNVDVISGLYLYKTPPFNPVAYQYIEEINGYNGIVKWDGAGELLNIDSAGAGALLVRRTVYERIINELKEGPFDIKGSFGEDHSFFNRLRELKIPAYLAVNVDSYHLAIMPLNYKRHFKMEAVEIDRQYRAEMK